MNFSNLLNEFASSNTGNSTKNMAQGAGNAVQGFTKNMPGGLAGGAVAGGLMAVLLGSKSARKTAGKAAKYGGAAVLGGLAYKAYKDWKHSGHPAPGSPAHNVAHSYPETASRFQSSYEREALSHGNNSDIPAGLEVNLVKAMVASARADGQIDAEEQKRISEAINKLNLDVNTKSELLNLFLQPISLAEVVANVHSLEHKAEVYLASCLVIDLDHESEYSHLSQLSVALGLPPGLEHQLRAQAANVTAEVA